MSAIVCLWPQYTFDPVEGRKPGARTTLMIRNIPNKYTQAMLLDILEGLCRRAAAFASKKKLLFRS